MARARKNLPEKKGPWGGRVPMPAEDAPTILKKRALEKSLEDYESKLKKRALLESLTEKELETERAKESPSNSAEEDIEAPAPKITKETWQGFCEMESDPAYFSVILRDLGVQDVTVREVFAMHPEMLDQLPQPIYGLILLFRHREVNTTKEGNSFPSSVWFANQMPAQNSCATLAMINILMNIDSIQIGEHMTQFKDFTHDFTPFQRGEAFASFDFVKKVHNSFAKEMDILENDKHLAYKATRAGREKTKKPKKSKPRRVRSTASPDADNNDDTDDCEETAHHFIAFVPIGNSVWKLDGMDTHPIRMATFNPVKGETWLSAVTDSINGIMAAGDDDYGIIAMTQSPLAPLREKACIVLNTLTHVENRLNALDPTWTSFLDTDNLPPDPPHPTMLGLEPSFLSSHPTPASTQAAISSEQLFDLLERRTKLLRNLSNLSVNIVAEMQVEAEEDAKAEERRYDYGPVVKRWLEMLAGNGYLEENLERFMGGGRG